MHITSAKVHITTSHIQKNAHQIRSHPQKCTSHHLNTHFIYCTDIHENAHHIRSHSQKCTPHPLHSCSTSTKKHITSTDMAASCLRLHSICMTSYSIAKFGITLILACICSIAASEHCSIRALQHQSTEASEHYSIRALQHQSTAASEHYSIRALQHQSTAASEHYSIRALQHQSTTASEHCSIRALQHQSTAASWHNALPQFAMFKLRNKSVERSTCLVDHCCRLFSWDTLNILQKNTKRKKRLNSKKLCRLMNCCDILNRFFYLIKNSNSWPDSAENKVIFIFEE